jgi:hypothetical protein
MGTVPPDLDRRTADQTVRGIYWAYDGASGLGTPPRLYNQIVREVAMKTPNPNNTGTPNTNTEEQNARLFALVNVAMADAGILAWDQKYVHDLWRPVVGIREHDTSMGPTGGGNDNIGDNCDPFWLPLGAPSRTRWARTSHPTSRHTLRGTPRSAQRHSTSRVSFMEWTSGTGTRTTCSTTLCSCLTR